MNRKWASNQHEHFYGYAQTESLFLAYKAAGLGNLSDLTLGELSNKDGTIRASRALEAVFGKESLSLVLKPEDKSLSEIASVLAKAWKEKPESVLHQFFEFGKQSRRDIQNYKFVEDIRKHLFKSLFTKNKKAYRTFVETAFHHTATLYGEVGPKRIAFSVPGTLFEKETLSSLRTVLLGEGTSTEFYYSYPRYKFVEDEAVFVDKVSQVTAAHEAGWGDGLDVTGSIEEGFESKAATVSLYRERLATLSTVLGRVAGAVLKIHAFEGSRTGNFYDAMWDWFTEMANPRRRKTFSLVIGHIARLEEEDIQKFEKLRDRGLDVAFDANFPSNALLHGVPAQRLVGLLSRLVKSNFEVGFGGDGQGILGAQTLTELEHFIGEHLPKGESATLTRRITEISDKPRSKRKGI